MNNGGTWIYKQEKRKTLQALAIIPRLHFYDSGKTLEITLEYKCIKSYNLDIDIVSTSGLL